MDYVRLSTNLYIPHVRLSRILYVYYVRLRTSYDYTVTFNLFQLLVCRGHSHAARIRSEPKGAKLPTKGKYYQPIYNQQERNITNQSTELNHKFLQKLSLCNLCWPFLTLLWCKLVRKLDFTQINNMRWLKQKHYQHQQQWIHEYTSVIYDCQWCHADNADNLWWSLNMILHSGCFHPNSGWNLVVFHPDHNLLLHGQPSRFSHGGEDGDANR